MPIKEIQAKTILLKQKKVDSWFVSRYGMNLYRGCMHNCSYCDGRAEKYQVDGEFGKDITVKVNAIDVLSRELNPERKRKPLKRGFIFVGGGVCDSYQSVELKYQLTRKALQVISQYDFPVHVLTKSPHVARDMNILKTINEKKRAIISMSFSSVDDDICTHFEPGVPLASTRLKLLEYFKKNGFSIGMYLMPVLPFITDTAKKIEQTVLAAKDVGIDFIVFGGMTMKGGRQQEHFMKVLKSYDESLVTRFGEIYQNNEWGQARSEYYQSIQDIFFKIAKAHNIPIRIPPQLWVDMLDESDRIIIMLEHIDYLLKMQGEKSFYGTAAFSISQSAVPIREHIDNLQALKGIGKSTEKLIREMLYTGSSRYYRWLLFGKP